MTEATVCSEESNCFFEVVIKYTTQGMKGKAGDTWRTGRSDREKANRCQGWEGLIMSAEEERSQGGWSVVTGEPAASICNRCLQIHIS